MNLPKVARWVGVWGAALVVGAEAFARMLGFHDTPVYERHAAFEYRTVPNQSGRVYNNRYQINALGMRGDMPDTSGTNVWVCGDSVINGGVHCDEDSLAVAQVDDRLEQVLGRQVSTLNISQGSWGPGNAWEFVRHYKSELGRPNAIVLVLNSRDWKDEMTHCYEGDSNDMPGSKSRLGLMRVAKELVGDDRECETLAARKGDTSEALLAWISFAREGQIPLAVHVHPSQDELKNRQWSGDGIRLIEFLNSHGVVVQSKREGMEMEDYRDQVHLNHAGQRHLSTALAPLIESLILPS